MEFQRQLKKKKLCEKAEKGQESRCTFVKSEFPVWLEYRWVR